MLTRAVVCVAALCALAAAAAETETGAASAAAETGAEGDAGQCVGGADAAELSVHSGLNATGHWLAEVRLQHAAEAGQREPVHLQLRRWARLGRRGGRARVVTLHATLTGSSASQEEELLWEEHAADNGSNAHTCAQSQDTPQPCPAPPPCPSAPTCPSPCPTCPTSVPAPIVTHQCPSPCPSAPKCPSPCATSPPCPRCPTNNPAPIVTHQCPSPCPSAPKCPSPCPASPPCPSCPTNVPAPIITHQCPSPCRLPPPCPSAPKCPSPCPQCPTCPACPARTPPGYVRYPGHGAYRLHLLPLNWFDAQATCEREGAHLAIINSQEEENIMARIFKTAGSLNPKYVLMGFHDTYVEGVYYTVLDQPLGASGYTKWRPGEPNNDGNEDCGGVYIDSMGLNDHKCGAAHIFLCEMP